MGKHHPSESLDFNNEQLPPPTSSQLSVEPRVIGGMTSDEMRNEVEWHSWRLKQKTWKVRGVYEGRSKEGRCMQCVRGGARGEGAWSV